MESVESHARKPNVDGEKCRLTALDLLAVLCPKAHIVDAVINSGVAQNGTKRQPGDAKTRKYAVRVQRRMFWLYRSTSAIDAQSIKIEDVLLVE